MYLQILVENKYLAISSVALILVPFCTWRHLYYSYKNLRNDYKEEILFKKRHNCVVMYTENKGMSGWPPHIKRVQLDINRENCFDTFYEPILYFINTAKKSLEVAFMLISVKNIHIALIEAQKRGVKVKILLNFENCRNKLTEIRDLQKRGIQVLPFISHSQELTSIMHYKYMVKDYTKHSGYVLTGSLNLTNSAFVNNYEDVVFFSTQYVAKAFHENFKECWDYVKTDNEGLINKAILVDADLA